MMYCSIRLEVAIMTNWLRLNVFRTGVMLMAHVCWAACATGSHTSTCCWTCSYLSTQRRYIYTVTFKFFFNNIITVCSATSLTGLMSSIDFSWQTMLLADGIVIQEPILGKIRTSFSYLTSFPRLNRNWWRKSIGKRRPTDPVFSGGCQPSSVDEYSKYKYSMYRTWSDDYNTVQDSARYRRWLGQEVMSTPLRTLHYDHSITIKLARPSNCPRHQTSV